MTDFKEKYLKYKSKYLYLKYQIGGTSDEIEAINNPINNRPSYIEQLYTNGCTIDQVNIYNLDRSQVHHLIDVNNVETLELPKFPNLKSLKFHSRYDAPLVQDGKKILPESLIKLSFPRESHFNQELKQYNLPSTLQELHFGIFFNNEKRLFRPDFLPPTLKKITLDRLITNGTDKYITVLHISLPRPTNTPINIPGGKNRNINLIPEKSYSESVDMDDNGNTPLVNI